MAVIDIDMLAAGEGFAVVHVGMERAGHDRPRPDDCHLDGKVVEVAWLGAWKRLDLGSAFNLEDAHSVAFADRLIDLRAVVGDASEVDASAVDFFDDVQALINGGEHPEREEV